MTFDATRHVVLLFGGGNQTQVFGDLWSWDGSAWHQLSNAGPAARMGAILAHDPDTGHDLLYGGVDHTGAQLTDLWSWDGTTWAQLSASGGPPIRHAAGGYDAARHRLVVHRGYSGTAAQRDTWEWDGTSWQQVTTATPAMLSVPLPSPMVYDPGRAALLMFIGDAADNSTALWQWSGTAWTSLGAGPSMSTPTPMALVATNNLLMLDGNPASSVTMATWRWNGSSWTALGIAGPPRRYVGASAFDPDRNQVVVFGGVSLDGSSQLGDTWVFDGAAWTKK